MITNSLLSTSYQTTSSQSTSVDVSTLGKDDFLKLLIAQLQNQDPLNPASNTEFVAQLAQFSSLEQMTLMNTNLEKAIGNDSSLTETISNAMMINYFGKNVSAETNSFLYDGGDAQLRFNLDSMTLGGKLEIYDSEGKIVRNINLASMNQGMNDYEWDGITDSGVKASPGIYTYKLDLVDSDGNKVEATPLYSGVVEGITYKDGMANLNVNGVLVPFSKITTITEE
jgi:flagellar basal-body rod modification protein FlgD